MCSENKYHGFYPIWCSLNIHQAIRLVLLTKLISVFLCENLKNIKYQNSDVLIIIHNNVDKSPEI